MTLSNMTFTPTDTITITLAVVTLAVTAIGSYIGYKSYMDVKYKVPHVTILPLHSCHYNRGFKLQAVPEAYLRP